MKVIRQHKTRLGAVREAARINKARGQGTARPGGDPDTGFYCVVKL